MKLRIQGNSVRLRLAPEDIKRFAEHGMIEDSIRFGTTDDSVLSFELKATEVGDRFHASYHSNRIIIDVPQELAGHWIDTEQVGISGSIHLPDGVELTILIEKDLFRGSPKRGADLSKTAPEPNLKNAFTAG